MEKLLNSSVLNRISCHHYKRQIRDKTSGTQTGSLIRRLKYFFVSSLKYFSLTKTFYWILNAAGTSVVYLGVFPEKLSVSVCFLLYPETLNNYSFAEDVSWKVRASKCSPFSFHDYIFCVLNNWSINIVWILTRDADFISILFESE